MSKLYFSLTKPLFILGIPPYVWAGIMMYVSIVGAGVLPSLEKTSHFLLGLGFLAISSIFIFLICYSKTKEDRDYFQILALRWGNDRDKKIKNLRFKFFSEVTIYGD